MHMTPSNMFRQSARFGIIPVFLVLSACADEGGTGPASAPSFPELDAEVTTFNSQFTLGTNPTNPSSAVMGSTTYNGVVSIVVNDASRFGAGQDLTLLGDMEVTTDFSADTISGFAKDFSDSDNDTYSGQLDIAGAVEDDVGAGQPAIVAGINGSLTNDRNSEVTTLSGSTTGNPNAAFTGDFYGTNRLFIGGTITGELEIGSDTYTLNGGSGVTEGTGGFLGGQ